MKFRRGGEIVIVIHDERGWFDARSEAKGDVFALARHLTGADFNACLALVGDLAGMRIEPDKPGVLSSAQQADRFDVAQRWSRRQRPWRGSQATHYLEQTRALPWSIMAAALARDLLREGPYGSVWAQHSNRCGGVIGWEERGMQWRGFASGGSKELFRFGPLSAHRICITEAAIDAMSLAAIEGLRDDTLYASTGGGWAPRTQSAIEAYANLPDIHLVAATDANIQGDVYADRIRQIAAAADCNFSRLRPRADDWNEDLKERREGNAMAPGVRRIKGEASPAVRPSPAEEG